MIQLGTNFLNNSLRFERCFSRSRCVCCIQGCNEVCGIRDQRSGTWDQRGGIRDQRGGIRDQRSGTWDHNLGIRYHKAMGSESAVCLFFFLFVLFLCFCFVLCCFCLFVSVFFFEGSRIRLYHKGPKCVALLESVIRNLGSKLGSAMIKHTSFDPAILINLPSSVHIVR